MATDTQSLYNAGACYLCGSDASQAALLKLGLWQQAVLTVNPTAATDPNSLDKLVNCYLASGTVSQAFLYKLGLMVEYLNAVSPGQATDPQTLLNTANCYLCGANPSTGDLYELALLRLILLAANPAASVDPQSLYNLTYTYLSAGTVGQWQLFKLGLLVQLVQAGTPAQAVDPQTLLNQAGCYNCGSNASMSDLFELGLLSFFFDGLNNPFSADLAGWWRLAGNGNDSSGNGATLTFTGTTTFVTGQQGVPNTAYTIGNGSYASVAATACNSWTTFSLSFWFLKNDSANLNGRLVEKGGNSEITCTGNVGNFTSVASAIFGTSGYSVQATGINQNQWYHFCVTVSGSGTLTETLYINGTAIGTATGTLPSATNNSIFLGTFGGGPGSFQLVGLLQDIRFWKNRVLMATEVATLFEEGAQ